VEDDLGIARLFDRAVTVCQAPVALVDTQLFSEELAHVATAVPKRRAEFGTARVCARKALATLGFEPRALVPGFDRAPVWPRGVTGSISHTHDWCAVVVCLTTQASSVGLDLERDCCIGQDLEPVICTPREREWLAAAPSATRQRLRTLLFSAKEAVYKCQYPLTRRMLDFLDLELEIEPELGRFQVHPVAVDAQLSDITEHLACRFRWSGGLVIAAARL
jgi:4'-phosphopantetheinyl transferase EntD